MARHILFITSNRLGDAVLSTGLLHHLLRTEPEAKVTIACGTLPSSLFAGYPLLDHLIAFQKEKYSLHWVKLWRQVAGTRWDAVIDLRNSAVSRLVWARRRYIYGPHIDQTRHKVEQAAETMRLTTIPDPALWFTAAQENRAAELIPPGGTVLGIGPTANWPGKTWPADNFIDIIAALTAPDGIFPAARIAVFAAPGEEEAAYQVLNSVPQDRRLDVIAKGKPGEIGAALARCALYIGNDSGLMHMAAAAGVPTFGLFGPSWPHLYRPWGPHTAFAATAQDFDQLIDFPSYDSRTVGSLMTTLTVKTVLAKIIEFCHTIRVSARDCAGKE